MLRGTAELVLVLVVIGFLLGLALSRNELLNPTLVHEQARRLAVETNSLAAKNDYERQKQQLDLEWQRARIQQELAWREQDHQRWQQFRVDAASQIVRAVVVFMMPVGIGVGVYIGCQGMVLLVRERQQKSSLGQFPP